MGKVSSTAIYASGDSWTYGTGLENRKNSFCDQLCTTLDADCYNLGINGGSNSSMFNQLFDRLDSINNSEYEKGYVVLTFTENGRDIRDYENRQFDYLSAYKNQVHDYNFYSSVLDDIEKEWQLKLDQLKESIDPRFKIITGCNFAKPKHIKLDIADPWISLLGYTDHVPTLTYVETTITLNQILNISSTDEHKQWLLDHSEMSIKIVDFLKSSEYICADKGHPNFQGHKIWADRILEEISVIG